MTEPLLQKGQTPEGVMIIHCVETAPLCKAFLQQLGVISQILEEFNVALVNLDSLSNLLDNSVPVASQTLDRGLIVADPQKHMSFFNLESEQHQLRTNVLVPIEILQRFVQKEELNISAVEDLHAQLVTGIVDYFFPYSGDSLTGKLPDVKQAWYREKLHAHLLCLVAPLNQMIGLAKNDPVRPNVTESGDPLYHPDNTLRRPTA